MDTAALKDSWAIVTKSGDDVPLFFYSHLFLSHPELRSMFPVSMSQQRDKLVGALANIVTHVDELDEVMPFINSLGSDHRRFAVEPEHYDAVGASLLATLGHFLGPRWTDELAADWTAAYGVIAKVMIDGAEKSAETTPSWWNAEVIATERRSVDVTAIHVRPDQPLPYRPGQSMAVEVPQRPRLWRYYSPANAPRDDGIIELHVQVVDGGQVSTAMVRTLRKGDTVKLGAPVGEALTLDKPPERVLMVAGGTGLAPLRAVVDQIDEHWQQNGDGPKVDLFHGARMPWNLYADEALTALNDRPWFDYHAAVSDDPSWQGLRGPVGAVAAGHGSWSGGTAYVCGSPAMVEHTVTQLTTVGGVPSADIRHEHFGDGGYQPVFAQHDAGGQS